MKTPRVAIITEYMHAFGGADRVIDSIIKIYPNAVLFSATFEQSNYPQVTNKVVTPGFFSQFFKSRLGKRFTALFPMVFEQFDLREYDLVISVSAGPSKGVITMVDTPHISIVCTPPRHQWDREINVRGSKLANIYRFGSKFISNYIRIWDVTAMSRVDYIISISKFIERKVYKRYRRESEVIYPGIHGYWFEKPSHEEVGEVLKKYKLPSSFLLVLSRLYDYKKVDDAIRACIDTKNNLVIAGDGPDRKYLEKIAREYKGGGSSTIKLLGSTQDSESRVLYNLADGLLFCGIEDFGLVPVEAMATGCPVIGYNEGGVSETVTHNESGYLYNGFDELVLLLQKKVWRKIDPRWCIMRAQKFTEKEFISKLKEYIEKVYGKEGLN